jgi:5-methylcytosine-specific restriction endonuclease McrA
LRPRVTDRRLIEALRASIGYCELCGCWPGSGARAVHHCRSRGSGGGDTLDNLIVLCPACHRKAHQGTVSREELKEIISERNLRIATEALRGRA